MVLDRVLSTIKEILNFSQVSNIIRKALKILYINISLTYILEVVVVESNLVIKKFLGFI